MTTCEELAIYEEMMNGTWRRCEGSGVGLPLPPPAPVRQIALVRNLVSHGGRAWIGAAGAWRSIPIAQAESMIKTAV